MKEAKENQEASDLKYWKEVRIWFFRVLKWLALALGIMMIIGFYTFENTPNESQTAITFATLFVLFVIFFHLEQHKS